jgi:opacity protein-like surface antigen
MRKLYLLTAVLALSALPAAAQDHSSAEIFMGYQFTHVQPKTNANGWNVSVAGNLNHWFGLKADFSGAYQSNFSAHTFMFGPVLTARQSETVQPFVHFLAGGAHFSNGSSTSGFSMALGGGVDIKIHDNVAFRLVQADWLPFYADSSWVDKSVRVSTGIVFRF